MNLQCAFLLVHAVPAVLHISYMEGRGGGGKEGRGGEGRKGGERGERREGGEERGSSAAILDGIPHYGITADCLGLKQW